MRFIFWCEFPAKVDWHEVQSILNEVNFKPIIYVAVQNMEQYAYWKRIIQKKAKNVKEVNAWPVLPKSKGYWFSGFTKEKDIDKLNDFKGLKIKVDLEPPLPKFKYSNLNVAKYLFNFKKGKNNLYLINTIQALSKNNSLLINEFPLPDFYLKRMGVHVNLTESMSRNYMAYTSVTFLLRPFLRMYLKWFLKRAVKKDPQVSASLGLAGPGIFENEPSFDNLNELKKDLETIKKLKINRCAIYSLETFMKRKDPKKWFSLVKSYSQ